MIWVSVRSVGRSKKEEVRRDFTFPSPDATVGSSFPSADSGTRAFLCLAESFLISSGSLPALLPLLWLLEFLKASPRNTGASLLPLNPCHFRRAAASLCCDFQRESWARLSSVRASTREEGDGASDEGRAQIHIHGLRNAESGITGKQNLLDPGGGGRERKAERRDFGSVS